MTDESLFDFRQTKEILSSQRPPDWLCNWPRFLFNGYHGLFHNGMAAEAWSYHTPYFAEVMNA